MSALKLNAVKRPSGKSAAKVSRKAGKIPAVVYGKKTESVAIELEYQAFRKVFREAGESSLIDLTVDGGKNLNVLVHDVQLHPVTDNFLHIDFISVSMDEEITTHVPIVVSGVAPAVKDFGGMLDMVRDQVTVKCLPKDIPHHFEVDITGLVDFHTVIHVSDLKLPKGVTVVEEPELTLITVSAPKEEKEEAQASAEAPAAENKAA
jgi:large subunit ribosomal protein L25